MPPLPTACTLDAIRVAAPSPVAPDLVGRWWIGRVHSVFGSVVNVDAPTGLVAIAAEAVGGLPDGVLVAGEPDFRSLGIRPGMVVHLGRDALTVPPTGLVVRLGRAVPWSPLLAAIADAGDSAGAAAPVGFGGWSTVVRLTAATGLAGSTTGRRATAALVDAIVRHDRDAAAAAADRLVGLGPGLTPSGDDILVGVEAAFRAIGHPLAGFSEALLAGLDRRTTAISAAMLRHAARGAFAERVHRLVADVCAGRPTGPTARWGASSGADTTAGLLLGLGALAPVPTVSRTAA